MEAHAHSQARDREPATESATGRAPVGVALARELAAGGVAAPSVVQALQRSIGNVATVRLLGRAATNAGHEESLLQDRQPLLRRGSSGPDVVQLQSDLNFVGADPPLVLDGIFGNQTLAAVKQLQVAAGLDVDGIVGPLTRRALSESVHVGIVIDVPEVLDRGDGDPGSGPGLLGAAGNLLGTPPVAKPPAKPPVKPPPPQPAPAPSAEEVERIKRLRSAQGQQDFDDIHKGTSPEANCPAIASAVNKFLDTGQKDHVSTSFSPKFTYNLGDRSAAMTVAALPGRVPKPGDHVLVQGFRADKGEHWFVLVNDGGQIVVLDGWFGSHGDRVKTLSDYLAGEQLVEFHT